MSYPWDDWSEEEEPSPEEVADYRSQHYEEVADSTADDQD